MRNKDYRITSLLLLLNFALWLAVGIWYSIFYRVPDEQKFMYFLILPMVWIDTILYLIFALGMKVKIRLAENLLYVFLGVNIVLCIMDEFGILDILALLLNLLTLLIYIRERKMRSQWLKKRRNHS